VAFAAVSIALQRGGLNLLAVSRQPEVNYTFTTQMWMLLVSSVALLVMFLWRKESFRTFFRIGGSTSSDEGSDWRVIGPLTAIGFTMGTMMYMSARVVAGNGSIDGFVEWLPVVLLFAATNSWSEEMVARFVIVAGLHGKLKSDAICWISAILFGVAHFYGTPNGVFGVFASGFLGWMLAKSVIDTRGMGWALLIHFLQDVVIFGGGAMVLGQKV
jgi:hypothetical protein